MSVINKTPGGALSTRGIAFTSAATVAASPATPVVMIIAIGDHRLEIFARLDEIPSQRMADQRQRFEKSRVPRLACIVQRLKFRAFHPAADFLLQRPAAKARVDDTLG